MKSPSRSKRSQTRAQAFEAWWDVSIYSLPGWTLNLRGVATDAFIAGYKAGLRLRGKKK